MNMKRKNKDTIDLVTMNTKEKAKKLRRECYHPFSCIHTNELWVKLNFLPSIQTSVV